LKSCGPDVSEWFVGEIKQFYKAAQSIGARFKKLGLPTENVGALSLHLINNPSKIPWAKDILEDYKRLARLADYKKRNDRKVEPFDRTGCPDSEPNTVNLCGVCVGTNQLGNIIFGVIAEGAGLVTLSRSFGRGDFKDGLSIDLKAAAGIIPGGIGNLIGGAVNAAGINTNITIISGVGPSKDWIQAPEKELAFDIGLLLADKSLTKKQLCSQISKFAKTLDPQFAGLIPVPGAIHSGPNTNMGRNPLTSPDGN